MLAQATSILGLLLLTMFIERSHMLTIPFTLARICLMLAELPRPHGCDSGLAATGYIVGGLCTVRYLAALPRRVLLMGQQVLSCVARRTSTEATSRRTGGLSKNPLIARTAAICSCAATLLAV
jgi:hypothetical protein